MISDKVLREERFNIPEKILSSSTRHDVRFLFDIFALYVSGEISRYVIESRLFV